MSLGCLIPFGWMMPWLIIAGMAFKNGSPWWQILGYIGLGILFFALGNLKVRRDEQKAWDKVLAKQAELGRKEELYSKHTAITTAAYAKNPELDLYLDLLDGLSGYGKTERLFKLLQQYVDGDERALQQVIIVLDGISQRQNSTADE